MDDVAFAFDDLRVVMNAGVTVNVYVGDLSSPPLTALTLTESFAAEAAAEAAEVYVHVPTALTARAAIGAFGAGGAALLSLLSLLSL